MPKLRLEHITKTYGKQHAIDDLSLEVYEGELLTLLGPSGCGKTTTLRAIAGFVGLDGGRIYIDDREISAIPPERRGIGLVFQNYALWPHMTVFQNLSFGLELKRLPKAEIRRRVESALAVVKLEGLGARFPRELSGGQQQRVALARALVLEPEILLLDEPLSNLDALLREQMRFEIAQIHEQLGITTIYVTHDQTEAMVMSQRISILNHGRIAQLGSPEEIYATPADRFVAEFIGATSFVRGTVTAASGDSCSVATAGGLRILGRGRHLAAEMAVDVVVRPENIELRPGSAEAGGEGERNLFRARVLRATYIGESMEYQIELGGSVLRARGRVTERLQAGDEVAVYLDPDRLVVLASSSSAASTHA